MQSYILILSDFLMALVTVIGAANYMFGVTVTGTHSQTLSQQYQSGIGGGGSSGGGSTVAGGGSTVAGGGSAPSGGSNVSAGYKAAGFMAIPTINGGHDATYATIPGVASVSGVTVAGGNVVTRQKMPVTNILMADRGGIKDAARVPGSADGSSISLPKVSGHSILPLASSGAISYSAPGATVSGSRVVTQSGGVSVPAVGGSVRGGHGPVAGMGITLPGVSSAARAASVSGSSVSGAYGAGASPNATVTAASSAAAKQFVADSHSVFVPHWADTISAAGSSGGAESHPKISISGPLSFLGGQAKPGGGSTNTVTAGNATIFSGTSDFYRYGRDGLSLVRPESHESFFFDTSRYRPMDDALSGVRDTLPGGAVSTGQFSFNTPSDTISGGRVDPLLNVTTSGVGPGFDFIKFGGNHHTVADFNRTAGHTTNLHDVNHTSFDKIFEQNNAKSTMNLDDGTQITFDNGAAAGKAITDDDIFKG